MYHLILSVTLLCVNYAFATSNANYFCADMKPQNSVDIEQLMGMWYGIEVISHRQDEEHAIEYFDTCPVIHLSEIRPPTTISPLHSDYNYGLSVGSGYGSGYGYGYQQPANPQQHDSYYNRDYYGRPTSSYGSHTTRGYNNRGDGYVSTYGSQQAIDTRGNGAGTGSNRRGQPKIEPMRRLRLLWDEGGENVEYLLRFNVTRAGFWISSGPQNGSILEKQYNQFAGTIQVMKAVGNHLVLTFCHQLPDKQLFSVLLSREPRLSRAEIHGVHNLLNRRELSTNHIKKVCSSGGSNNAFKNVTFVVIVGLMVTFFLSVDLSFPATRRIA